MKSITPCCHAVRVVLCLLFFHQFTFGQSRLLNADRFFKNNNRDIASGTGHNLQISNGKIFAWGSNDNGQLGTGNYDDQVKPAVVGTDNDWIVVTAGDNFSLAIKTNGSLWKIQVNKPLPVTWISFTAEKINKDVMLQWITTNETGNRGFDIQHSIDGQHWNTIGWQFATEATYGNHGYSFLHARPGQGIHFYRLRQIDHDGQTGYSIIQTAVLEQTSEPIVIYPNPVADKFFIGGREHQQSNIVIIDDRGNVVKSVREIKGPIDVSGFRSGVYFLQVDGSSEWKKFIKQ